MLINIIISNYTMTEINNFMLVSIVVQFAVTFGINIIILKIDHNALPLNQNQNQNQKICNIWFWSNVGECLLH